ncbi:nitroreductase family protein [Candidatus Woesearchaeota archaeon]|jgi:nitroreductase|nr:nitroreductase family protein [Candidatus Woesearchaeota archaeon]
MELDKIIHERRTCRDFKKKDLSTGTIAEALDISRFAPSSGNVQNWYFVIVRDNEKKEALADECHGQVWMVDAPALIVICNKTEECTKKFKEKGEKFSIQNCAIISSYITLKATDMGLGTAMVGAFDEEKVRMVLDIPYNVTPEGIIAIGHPNSLDEDQDREDLKYHTYFESWGKKVFGKDSWPISKPIGKATKKASQATNRAKLKASGLLRKTKEKLKK